jgi:GTPase SAR1 family protein
VVYFKVKIIIVGEPGAGKSFIAKTTDACYPTREIGASIGKITMNFQDTSCEMTLITWAITQGRPKESTHLEHSQAAIIVCDLTKPDTVLLTPVWADRVHNIVGDIPLFFAANNADMGTSDDINLLKRVANKFNSSCFPIHSEDRKSARKLFRTIAQVLSENLSSKKRLYKKKGIDSEQVGDDQHFDDKENLGQGSKRTFEEIWEL